MRRHRDVLGIGTTIGQAKHLISLFEAFFSATLCAQFGDRTRELYTKNLRSAGRYRIHSFAL
jgi:hypothetical protein